MLVYFHSVRPPASPYHTSKRGPGVRVLYPQSEIIRSRPRSKILVLSISHKTRYKLRQAHLPLTPSSVTIAVRNSSAMTEPSCLDHDGSGGVSGAVVNHALGLAIPQYLYRRHY